MKDIAVEKITYFIKPRMEKHWFVEDEKVYDLFEKEEGARWVDPSYGNGGGDFMPFKNTNKIYTFKKLIEAQQFKNELEKYLHNQNIIYTFTKKLKHENIRT